jgi:peptidyl-tRNA hydrolase
VLTRFDAGERATVEEAIGRAADAVETWISSGMSAMMNTFNRAEDRSEAEGRGPGS